MLKKHHFLNLTSFFSEGALEFKEDIQEVSADLIDFQNLRFLP